MAKNTPKTSTSIPARDCEADLSTANEELTSLETSLALTRAGAATSPDDPRTIVIALEQIEAKIAAKKMEINIILQRIDAETKAKVAAEHQAKVAELAAILPERLGLLEEMDEHIEALVALAGKLDSLDSFAPMLGGCRTREPIYNRSWARRLLELLAAKASIGVDVRANRGIPLPKLADHARGLHAEMLEEYRDRPQDLAAFAARNPMPKLIHPEGYRLNSAPEALSDEVKAIYRTSHGGNATNYRAVDARAHVANAEPRPERRLSTDVLEEPYE